MKAQGAGFGQGEPQSSFPRDAGFPPGWLEALDPWLQVLRAVSGQGVRGLVRAVVCAGRAGEKWSSAEVALAAARNSVQVAEQAAA